MRPRRASPKPLVVATIALVVCGGIALASRSAQAAIPVTGAAIERALADIVRAPAAADAHARFLMVLTALDALPVAKQVSWLDRIAALDRAPLMAARARFECWAFEAGPTALGELGLVTDAVVSVGEGPPTRAAPVVPGPRGALALDPWLHVASGRDVAHVAFGSLGVFFDQDFARYFLRQRQVHLPSVLVACCFLSIIICSGHDLFRRIRLFRYPVSAEA